MRKKFFVQNASVILIVAIVLLTSVVVADTHNQPTITYMKKTIAWSEPSFDETELKYYNEENLNTVIGISGSTPPYVWKTAIRLTQDEMAPFPGWTMTDVKVAYSADNGCPSIDVRVYIYDEGTSTHPGSIIANDTTYTLDVTGITTIPLATPVSLVGHDELWVAIEWTQMIPGPGVYYAWMDTLSGPAIDGKGDWIYYNNAWLEIQTLGPEMDGNWGLGAIIEGTAQQPPQKPTLSGPTNGIINTQYTYMVSSTDPEGDDVFYYLEWGDGANSGWIGPGDEITADHSWTDIGAYTIRAKARDIYHAESPWSDPLILTIKGPILTIGAITGGTGVSFDINNIGGAEATNVVWTIRVIGGLVGRTILDKSQTISSIAAGGTETIKALPLGLGSITITISVSADTVPMIQRKAEGSLMIFIVTINPPTGIWWPMFHYDAGNTGSSQGKAPNTNHVIWKKNVGKELFSRAPIIVDNRVYVSTGMWNYADVSPPDFSKQERPRQLIDWINTLKTQSMQEEGALFCLDADYGTSLWNISLTGNDPAIYEGRLYVTSMDLMSYEDSMLYCLDAETGSTLWTKQLDGWVFSSMIIEDEKIYMSIFDIFTYQGYLNCFDLNGTSLWQYPLAPYEIVFSSPAVGDGKAIFAAVNLYGYYYDEGSLYCFNADTGSFLWSKPVSQYPSYEFTASPVYKDDRVYYVEFSLWEYTGYLNCYNATTGALQWDYPVGFSISTPAVDETSVYVPGLNFYSYENSLFRIDRWTGSLQWKRQLTEFTFISTPVVADEKIYLNPSYFYSRNVYCYDVNTGNQLWNYLLEESTFGSPGIAADRLFTSDMVGNVYAFEDTLKIGQIKGGIASAKAEVKNTGVSQYMGITWTITVKGGSSNGINVTSTGGIASLEAGTSVNIRVSPIVGIGPIQIWVTLNVGSITIKEKRDGYAAGVFVFISEPEN